MFVVKLVDAEHISCGKQLRLNLALFSYLIRERVCAKTRQIMLLDFVLFSPSMCKDQIPGIYVHIYVSGINIYLLLCQGFRIHQVFSLHMAYRYSDPKYKVTKRHFSLSFG